MSCGCSCKRSSSPFVAAAAASCDHSCPCLDQQAAVVIAEADLVVRKSTSAQPTVRACDMDLLWPKDRLWSRILALATTASDSVYSNSGMSLGLLAFVCSEKIVHIAHFDLMFNGLPGSFEALKVNAVRGSSRFKPRAFGSCGFSGRGPATMPIPDSTRA